MFRSTHSLLAVLFTGASAFAQDQVQFIVSRSIDACPGCPESTVLPPAPQTAGSDSCSTPTPITGTGPHPFDTSGATAGPEGQTTSNCSNSTSLGCDSDVWFDWTAPATGTYELTTCGLALRDTLVAVYSGTTCPTPGTLALACNDDITRHTQSGVTLTQLRSRVTISVTAGAHYLIQVGYKVTVPPVVQGPGGQFRFDLVIAQPPYARSNNSAEAVWRVGPTETDTLWMMAQGDVTTGQRLVLSVKTAAGAPFAASQSTVVNGNPITLGVWEDPNDDENPADAVLLSTFTSVVSSANTSVKVVYTLPTPVIVDNVFFVGASYSHGANTGYPAPVDVNGCVSRPGQAFLAGNIGPVDFANLAANTQVPQLITGTSSLSFLTEADTTTTLVGTVFCIGDAVTPHTACPCGNASATADEVGCLSSLAIGGKLRAVGVASLANDSVSLQGSQMPDSSVLYFQGTTQQNGGNGVAFGDGLRCAGGAIVRLGNATNVGGSSTYPSGADPAVHVQGNVAAAGTRTYQAWYRNAAAFCTASTFNLTNGVEINWTP